MRTLVACLVAAVALCLVLPYCGARPSSCCVKKSVPKACGRSLAVASSEGVVKKVGCGCNKKVACGCAKKPRSSCAKKPRSGLVAGGVVAAALGTVGVAAGTATRIAGRTVSTVLSPGSPSSCEPKVDSCTELSEGQIKVRYARLKDECQDAYYKRILSRSFSWTKTTEGFLKTLNLVRKDFCDLDLWYNRKYIPLVKDYYLTYYGRKDGEPLESYFSRLVLREFWESDEIFARRMTIVRDCFPNLDLWLSDKWFDKYTKPVYAIEFKKFPKESEEEYIERIFERDAIFDTNDEIWAKRLFLVQEATINSCPLWYSDKYLPYFKKFYTVYYKKLEQETYEDWLARVLTPLPSEPLDNAITRIKYIKEVTGSWGYWKPECFKKIQQTKRLDDKWLIKVQKSFFPSCGCASSSKKLSAVASASASVSS